jgi:hypothetical protein
VAALHYSVLRLSIDTLHMSQACSYLAIVLVVIIFAGYTQDKRGSEGNTGVGSWGGLNHRHLLPSTELLSEA